MSAICGFLDFGGQFDSSELCRRMLEAQKQYAPDDRSTLDLDGLSFGRGLFRLLPEDRFDRQPLAKGGGRYVLSADLRLDHREDLVRELGLPLHAPTLSDSEILFLALERWHLGVLDRINGDYAFAVWDRREQLLHLARDPLGQRPLCFHAGKNFFAFSSMPSGLSSLGIADFAPDEEQVAAFLADVVPLKGRSFFSGIGIVDPAHYLTVSSTGVESRRYWSPRPRNLGLRSFEEAVDAFREQLDRSVKSQLRGCDGHAGAHLSSGYDSSAVASTAAKLLRPSGGRVTAFTSAPREGFAGPLPRGRIADESILAAETAAFHPNMDHVILRPQEASPFELMERTNTALEQPISHVCNNTWWWLINESARARGIRVMLLGQMGNVTISAGGLKQLPDFIRKMRWRDWIREARALVAKEQVTWRGVLASSFGPWIPHPLWRALTHYYQASSLQAGKPLLLRQEWLEVLLSETGTCEREIRPPKNSLDLRMDIVRRQGPGCGRKAALALWGIDARDPTGDRRLMEFCFSLPLEMLLRNGERRPVAKAALRDRVPASVLDFKMRGLQMADWYEHFTKERAQAALVSVANCPAVARVVDLVRLQEMIDSWPPFETGSLALTSDYRGKLLPALSAAQFMCAASSERIVEERVGKAVE